MDSVTFRLYRVTVKHDLTVTLLHNGVVIALSVMPGGYLCTSITDEVNVGMRKRRHLFGQAIPGRGG
ncbi:hypothetical protein EFO53_02965 [Lacticaseibacillus rhamnosus]|uniref:Uncharacterized protein n=1 Tax=Lacticaseibacillus rhamnosus TaxID=47715 RepID=A0AB74IBH9_LACRH|nr:hypothetical protein [Lacticaseibacillus rhamnosus]MCT3146909.1 hypothetical protein [Lacticaseibacillus rhamnosus]MCT3151657.1 hypothetical protein [Lacticaseibacillus rhamnosus]MCT3156912.1 hypothetical protein [Lacticaseibacillus rhamnosus]MCT3158436.1 hypothetical protein [Lacticaseibacillus rhamnosus]